MEKLRAFSWQFIKFGLVGASSTLVHTGVYMLLILANINTNIAYIVGFLLSTINAYIWQSKFVFAGGDHSGKRMAKAVLGYIPGTILGLILLNLYTHVWFLPKLYAQILTVPFTIPFNFILQKKWAFKE